MFLFKASLLVLAFTLAIQGSKGLTSCYQCEYKEDDADISCLNGNPTHSVVVPGTPSDGMQFVCTVELKTEEGKRFVKRTFIEIENGLDPNFDIEGPIELTFNPGENYIRFHACNSDNCNAQIYQDPPPFPPGSDIKCYDCRSSTSNCEITPNNLIDVPRIPYSNYPRSKSLLEISSSSNEVQYTSEPIGEFGWEAYCEILWVYNEQEQKRIWTRGMEWFHKDYTGDMNGNCTRRTSSEYCYCKGDGCNNYVQPGLQCYDCSSSGSNKACETNPTSLKLYPDDWVTPGTKYVCTLEARYSSGTLSVIRSSQLVKDTEASNQCIAGPTEGGQYTNPETNYISLCSCATNSCNGNTTFDKPPKLPSPLKCYECRLSEDPGCNIPDSKYLKDIPAVPDYMSSRSANESAVAGRRSGQVNELTPSEPIGKYHNVVYCETWYSKVLKGIGSRGAKYNYEPEPGKGGLDGQCVQDEKYPDWRYCYCKTDGCNNESGAPALALTGSLLVIGIIVSSWYRM